MAIGFGVLRLSPADFWSMTPRELAAATGAIAGTGSAAPIDRVSLSELMHRFPDSSRVSP
jgi:uncharacterized phage protein (TIGR02216 family)